MPVPWLVIFTTACWISAPLASDTTPVKEAVSVWAFASGSSAAAVTNKAASPRRIKSVLPPDDSGQDFILIGGDKVGVGRDRGMPANLGRLARAEIVFSGPALILVIGEAVDFVEAHQVSQAVPMFDEPFHAGFAGSV